ncbi:MAG: M23 family metallopeptidase [Gemmatimonadota bacterium]|nr:M23 family metallopeptidase [Gemmatimonadota bacterium]
MVLYAHLQQGSLNPSLVKDADVSAGDFLGLVGSSGRSTEPHLHIHAAFGSVIYGPMRPILFREAQFLGKHHAIMPIGESPRIDANGKEIPAMRSLIWPSSEARTGWPRDWPRGHGRKGEGTRQAVGMADPSRAIGGAVLLAALSEHVRVGPVR